MASEQETPPVVGVPYRDAPPKEIRFLCTVCFGSASMSEAGTCARCGASRLPLDNTEVVEMLRKHVVGKTQRMRSRIFAGVLVLSAGLSALICYAFNLPFFDDLAHMRISGSYFISFTLGFGIVLGLLSLRVFKEPSDDVGVRKLLRRLKLSVDP